MEDKNSENGVIMLEERITVRLNQEIVRGLDEAIERGEGQNRSEVMRNILGRRFSELSPAQQNLENNVRRLMSEPNEAITYLLFRKSLLNATGEMKGVWAAILGAELVKFFGHLLEATEEMKDKSLPEAQKAILKIINRSFTREEPGTDEEAEGYIFDAFAIFVNEFRRTLRSREVEKASKQLASLVELAYLWCPNFPPCGLRGLVKATNWEDPSSSDPIKLVGGFEELRRSIPELSQDEKFANLVMSCLLFEYGIPMTLTDSDGNLVGKFNVQPNEALEVRSRIEIKKL